MIYVNDETKEKFKDEYFSVVDNEEEKEAIEEKNNEIIKEFNEELEKSKVDAYKDCPIKLFGKLSLIEQKPWIQNKTIRDNILFGSELDPDKYNKIIEICQLGRDLEILDGGDLTEIGEKASNLSGGQKARISIARAIYSEFDILLMDDPLSALDAHVKKEIFEKVCLEYLNGKTRILVTHAIDFLDKVDRILVMQNGKFIYDGTFEELKNNDYFTMILEQMNKDEGLNTEAEEDKEEKKESEKDEEEEENKSDSSSEELLAEKENTPINYMSKTGSTITFDENKEDSSSKQNMYLKYFGYNKVATIFIIFGTLFIMISRAASVGFDLYLLKWIRYTARNKENNPELLSIMVLLCIVLLLFVVVGVYFFYSFSIRLSKSLFHDINNRVFNAPINLYFDRTPTGVILNRFSKDLNSVDISLGA